MTPTQAPPSSAAAASSSCSSQPKNPRSGQEGAMRARLRAAPERSASFHHGSGAAATEHRQLRRPKTQPELLFRGGAATSSPSPPRVPAKVLVNVAVQRSLGPVQVVASTDWTVGELVATALARYDREGRRPSLPAADPSAFELHYSQFSLECLNSEEKLINLGSRNFFLCLKPTPAPPVPGTAEYSNSSGAASCSKQAEKGSKMRLSWLSFIDCLL